MTLFEVWLLGVLVMVAANVGIWLLPQFRVRLVLAGWRGVAVFAIKVLVMSALWPLAIWLEVYSGVVSYRAARRGVRRVEFSDVTIELKDDQGGRDG